MNTLSLLIYAASVIESLRGTLQFLVFVFSMLIIFSWLARLFAGGLVLDYDMPSSRMPEGSKDYQRFVSVRNFTAKRWLYIVPIIAVLLATFLPSERVIYLIAASEVGEIVVTSPDTKEILDGLKDIIKQKINEQLVPTTTTN